MLLNGIGMSGTGARVAIIYLVDLNKKIRHIESIILYYQHIAPK